MSFLEVDVSIARPRFDVQARLDADQGRVLALIGPNGAGKSTLVDALCGLRPLDTGRVSVGGACWEDTSTGVRLAPQRRSVGVMFQGPSLFPNMTALDNVAFGIRSQGLSKPDARRQAAAVLERLGGEALVRSRADRLSGGESQKVAMARALATEPDLLLLDEPSSQLDANTRVEVRRALSETVRGFNGVVLVVTHQPLEAMALAQEVLVMEEGHVTQRGDPSELRLRPRSAYVAQFAGVNLLEGRSNGDLVELAGGASVAVSNAPRGDVFVVIDPNAIALHRTSPEGTPRNVWRLEVAHVDLEGDRVRLGLAGEPTLVAEITRAAAAQLKLTDKGMVWASTKATQVQVYPR